MKILAGRGLNKRCSVGENKIRNGHSLVFFTYHIKKDGKGSFNSESSTLRL